jgi:hypothetical protein
MLRGLPSAVAARPRRGDWRQLHGGRWGVWCNDRLALAECVTTNWNTLFRVCLPGFVAVLFCEPMLFFFQDLCCIRCSG